MGKWQVMPHTAMPPKVTSHLAMTIKVKASKMTSPARMVAPEIIDLGKIAGDTIVLEEVHHLRMGKMATTATAHRVAREMASIMKNHVTKTMKMRIERWVEGPNFKVVDR